MEDADSLLALLESNPDGLSQKELIESGWDKQRLLQAANALKGKRRLEVAAQGDGLVLFKAVAADTAVKFDGLTEEHRTLYKLIKDSGDTGIWTKDLQRKSGMATASLTRLAKMLESRRLIKQVAPIQSRTRKVWMLYELEPSSEVSGGSWYKDGAIDADLVDSLRESAYEYIAGCSKPVALTDIHRYLTSQGENRSIEDVDAVMFTLELERRVANQGGGKAAYSVRSQVNLSAFDSLETIPCLRCPVISRCCPGAEVSPETCKYLNTWLQLSDELEF